MNALTCAHPVKPIAAVQGASSDVIQAIFRAFAESEGLAAKIVGVVGEAPDESGVAAGPAALRSLADGRRYTIFQSLGTGALSCGLDAGGVAEACEAVRGDIASGCDLVILSKFAQLEADRSGLAQAFAAAVEAGVPILTAVSPKFMLAWDQFAAPYYEMLPATGEAVANWWLAVRGSANGGPE